MYATFGSRPPTQKDIACAHGRGQIADRAVESHSTDHLVNASAISIKGYYRYTRCLNEHNAAYKKTRPLHKFLDAIRIPR